MTLSYEKKKKGLPQASSDDFWDNPLFTTIQ